MASGAGLPLPRGRMDATWLPACSQDDGRSNDVELSILSVVELKGKAAATFEAWRLLTTIREDKLERLVRERMLLKEDRRCLMRVC